MPVISEDRARTIASGWHGGGSSALYEFSSTGASTRPKQLVEEIKEDIRWLARERSSDELADAIDGIQELINLLRYVYEEIEECED